MSFERRHRTLRRVGLDRPKSAGPPDPDAPVRRDAAPESDQPEPGRPADGPRPEGHGAPASDERFRDEAQPGPDGRPRWWRDMVRRRLLAAADVVAAIVAIAALTGGLAGLAWAIATLPLWVLGAKLFGLYDRDHRALRHTTFDELGPLAVWVGAMVLALAWLVLPFTPAETPPAGAIGLAWALGFAVAVAGRGIGRWAWRRAAPPERCLVIGDGALARSIKRKAELFPDLHLDVADDVGSIDDVERDPEAFVRAADRLVVASEDVAPALVDRLVIACRERQVRLSVISPLRQRARPARRLGQIADLPVLECDTTDLSRSTLMLKRAMDLALGSAATALALPLIPLIVVAIKLDSRGPILFVQTRAGLRGEPFRMYKFRTMVPEAEQQRDELVDLDALSEPMFKLRDDPRVTRVGRILRRLSLDEIPQLINVLGGEMSLVGPRPEEVDVVDRYAPEHRFRLEVKPGLTGPMQVYGRSELTFEERLEVELDYVENLGIGHDLRILGATIPAVMRGDGAH